MLIIPAIDLMDGKVVRLRRGDFSDPKFYSDNPSEVARRWKDEGAPFLHIVDLDGAREGKPKNLKSVEEIIKAAGTDLELGGGIRDFKTLKTVFDMGISKAVLGTRAVTDESFSKECIAKFTPEKIIFSIDARKEDVLTSGWELDSGHDMKDLLKKFQSAGLQRIIYTDVLRDGMMTGPNLKKVQEIIFSTELEVIVSGGISGINDIKRLSLLKSNTPGRVLGVIIGKALYEGKINLKEALRAG